MEGYSEFALSDEEKARGLILACRAVPWEDSEVAWLEEDDLIVHPRRLLDCTVVGLDDATHDIKRVRLAIASGGPFDFSAGQFASVTFEGCPPRDYSMANVPGDPVLEFHVRHTAGGATSAHVARTSSRSATTCASRGRSAPPTCARAIADRSSPSPAARAWRRSSRSSSGRCRRRCRSTSTSISASAPSATSTCTTISPRWPRQHDNLHFMPVLSEGDGANMRHGPGARGRRRRLRRVRRLQGLPRRPAGHGRGGDAGCSSSAACGASISMPTPSTRPPRWPMRARKRERNYDGTSGRTCRHRHRRRPRHRPRHRRIAGGRGRERDRGRQRRLDRRRRRRSRGGARGRPKALRQEGDRLHRERRLARRRQASRRDWPSRISAASTSW